MTLKYASVWACVVVNKVHFQEVPINKNQIECYLPSAIFYENCQLSFFSFVKLSLVDINTDSRMRVILIAILQDKYAPLFE